MWLRKEAMVSAIPRGNSAANPSRREFLLEGAVVLAGAILSPPAPRLDRPIAGPSGIVDCVRFQGAGEHLATAALPSAGLVHFQWTAGEREMTLSGVPVSRGGTPLTFHLHNHGCRKLLTLVLREFRARPTAGIAYLIEVNSHPIAFRNGAYHGPGPTTAFVDIPGWATGRNGPLEIKLTNLADDEICFAEAVLYCDLEAHAAREGLVTPLCVLPTVSSRVTMGELRQLRELFPARDGLRPGFAIATFPVAIWDPVTQAKTLDELIHLAKTLRLALQVQAITWWAGTPSGFDGKGGRWIDTPYQQVTYQPSRDLYGLSVPNVWSNTPWLTVGNQRLNAFKASAFENFGALLRKAWLRHGGDLPALTVVLDNEVTYWVAGDPGMPPDLEGDFNPAMVERAKAEGVDLSPGNSRGEGQLSERAKIFLRRSLLDYNRRMHTALRRGLGDCPLSETVYTHTFINPVAGLFDGLFQSVEVGVLRHGRVGLEWAHLTSRMALLEQFRELGVPADINRECGSSPAENVVRDVHAAYAGGCSSLTLFNVSNDKLAQIAPSLRNGWGHFRPKLWRPTVFSEDFQDRKRLDHVLVAFEHLAFQDWPGNAKAMYTPKVNTMGRALLRFKSRQILGRASFGRLVLRYTARALVFRQLNPNGYLEIRAGTTPGDLRPINRLYNSGIASHHVDLTTIAAKAPEIYIEFVFHTVGLPGWVALFNLALEKPWPEKVERLFASNRSYGGRRLRAEASLVGWRADAAWSLELAAALPPGALSAGDKAQLAGAWRKFAEGSYRRANEMARTVIRRHAPTAQEPAEWQPPPLDRRQTGGFCWAGTGSLTLEPYRLGIGPLTIPAKHGLEVRLQENGRWRPKANLVDLRSGDDVVVTVRKGVAIRVTARCGTASARIVALTPITPFEMPTITLENQPARIIDMQATLRSAGGRFWGDRSWFKVGPLPFDRGQMVQARWNPTTNRIIECSLATP